MRIQYDKSTLRGGISMKKIFVALFLFVLVGCASNQDPYDLLSQSIDNTNALKGWKEVSVLKGSQFDEYGEDKSQIERNSISNTNVLNDGSDTYYLQEIEENGMTSIFVDYYKQNESKEILALKSNEDYFYSFSVDLDNYEDRGAIWTQFLDDEQYRKCYEFKKESNDNETVIYANLIDSEKFAELETNRLSQLNPDYNSLLTYNGIELPKREYKRLDYEFHINQDNVISSYTITTEQDLGVGYNYLVQEVTLSDLGTSTLNAKKLNQLLEKTIANEIESGEKITSYIK